MERLMNQVRSIGLSIDLSSERDIECVCVRESVARIIYSFSDWGAETDHGLDVARRNERSVGGGALRVDGEGITACATEYHTHVHIG